MFMVRVMYFRELLFLNVFGEFMVVDVKLIIVYICIRCWN